MTGKVLTYNKVTGVGVLLDTKNQTIRFHADDSKKIPNRGSIVSFEMTLRERHEVAINLKMIESVI